MSLREAELVVADVLADDAHTRQAEYKAYLLQRQSALHITESSFT